MTQSSMWTIYSACWKLWITQCRTSYQTISGFPLTLKVRPWCCYHVAALSCLYVHHIDAVNNSLHLAFVDNDCISNTDSNVIHGASFHWGFSTSSFWSHCALHFARSPQPTLLGKAPAVTHIHVLARSAKLQDDYCYLWFQVITIAPAFGQCSYPAWLSTDKHAADFDMSQYLHPNRIAPRCLPCNYTDPAEGPPNNKTYVGFRAPRVSFYVGAGQTHSSPTTLPVGHVSTRKN